MDAFERAIAMELAKEERTPPKMALPFSLSDYIIFTVLSHCKPLTEAAELSRLAIRLVTNIIK